MGFSISLFGLNLFRQYKADPAGMNQAVYRVRESVWSQMCFMFDAPAYTSSDHGLGIAKEVELLQKIEERGALLDQQQEEA